MPISVSRIVSTVSKNDNIGLWLATFYSEQRRDQGLQFLFLPRLYRYLVVLCRGSAAWKKVGNHCFVNSDSDPVPYIDAIECMAASNRADVMFWFSQRHAQLTWHRGNEHWSEWSLHHAVGITAMKEACYTLLVRNRPRTLIIVNRRTRL